MIRNIICLMLAAVVFAAGCGEEATETESVQAKITNVEIYNVVPSVFTDYINLPIIVRPNKVVNLGLTEGGRVTGINVDKGDRVKKDMVLLETDDVLLRANLEIAEANLAYQKNEFARSEKLFNEGSITAAAYDGAKLQLSQARNSYDIARKRLDDAVLKASFPGIVTSRNAEVGDLLGPGSPAFRIIDVSTIKVQAGIPERYITDFSVGNTVSIAFDAISERVFEGRINFISPEANTSVRTFLAEILVKNGEGLIKAGLMGDARILRKVHENAIMIPINAIIETQNGRIVFIARGDTVEERAIMIGGSTDIMVQVLSGLKPGERVIVKGQHDLVTGEQINVTGEYTVDSEG